MEILIIYYYPDVSQHVEFNKVAQAVNCFRSVKKGFEKLPLGATKNAVLVQENGVFSLSVKLIAKVRKHFIRQVYTLDWLKPSISKFWVNLTQTLF